MFDIRMYTNLGECISDGSSQYLTLNPFTDGGHFISLRVIGYGVDCLGDV